MTNGKEGKGGTAPQGKLRVDYGKADARHAMVCMIQGTGDEVVVDFASHPLPGANPKEALLSIHTRMGMSYPTTKRLAMLLAQAVQRYEKVFGLIDIESQKRTAQLLQKGGKLENDTARFPGSGGST